MQSSIDLNSTRDILRCVSRLVSTTDLSKETLQTNDIHTEPDPSETLTYHSGQTACRWEM